MMLICIYSYDYICIYTYVYACTCNHIKESVARTNQLSVNISPEPCCRSKLIGMKLGPEIWGILPLKTNSGSPILGDRSNPWATPFNDISSNSSPKKQALTWCIIRNFHHFRGSKPSRARGGFKSGLVPLRIEVEGCRLNPFPSLTCGEWKLPQQKKAKTPRTPAD